MTWSVIDKFLRVWGSGRVRFHRFLAHENLFKSRFSHSYIPNISIPPGYLLRRESLRLLAADRWWITELDGWTGHERSVPSSLEFDQWMPYVRYWVKKKIVYVHLKIFNMIILKWKKCIIELCKNIHLSSFLPSFREYLLKMRKPSI